MLISSAVDETRAAASLLDIAISKKPEKKKNKQVRTFQPSTLQLRLH